jgi:hypothetical protein
MHRTLLEHPGLIDVLQLKPTSSLAGYHWLDRLVGALRGAGLDKETAMLAVITLESYTIGFAIQQGRRPAWDPVEDRARDLSLLEAEFPNLAGDGISLLDWASDELFLAGLTRQIAGLEPDRIA